MFVGTYVCPGYTNLLFHSGALFKVRTKCVNQVFVVNHVSDSSVLTCVRAIVYRCPFAVLLVSLPLSLFSPFSTQAGCKAQLDPRGVGPVNTIGAFGGKRHGYYVGSDILTSMRDTDG